MRCEKLRFDQALTLGAPNVTVGPSLLDARPKGVASKGGFGGVKRGQGNHTVPLPPFVSAGRPRLPPAAGRRHSLSAVGTAFPLLRRVAAFPANHPSGSSRAQIPRVFFIFSGLQLTFSIFHGILNYRKQKKSRCLGNISSLINGIRHLVLPTPAGGKISPQLRPVTRQMAHTAYLYNYYTINKRLCQYDARFSTKINFSSLYDTFYLCNITNFRFLVRI